MAHHTPNGKRPRLEDRAGMSSAATLGPEYVLLAMISTVNVTSANWFSRDTIDYSRCAWLEITEASKPTYNYTARTVRLYVPQGVLRYVPSYEGQLNQQKATLKGDTQPTIRDPTPRNPEVVSKAIRFLVSGYLFPLDASSNTCKDTLEDLIKLYQFSTTLSIKRLEMAVFNHIDTFDGLTLAVFLAFARSYYSTNGAQAQNTSLGELIKKKLAAFLQCMVDLKSVDEIKNEDGVLGRQLIEVLLEERAAGKAQQKHTWPDTPIKIEDD